MIVSARIGTRVGVSIPDDDVRRIDELISSGVYSSRSQAVRELVRDALRVLSGRS